MLKFSGFGRGAHCVHDVLELLGASEEGVSTSTACFSKVGSGEMGPAPGRFEPSKGILK